MCVIARPIELTAIVSAALLRRHTVISHPLSHPPLHLSVLAHFRLLSFGPTIILCQFEKILVLYQTRFWNNICVWPLAIFHVVSVELNRFKVWVMLPASSYEGFLRTAVNWQPRPDSNCHGATNWSTTLNSNSLKDGRQFKA